MYKIKKYYFPILILFITISGCAYYNTFFNAEERYAAGEKKIETSPNKEITPEIRKDFYTAIDKSWKLINIYGDSSSYADDALFLIGKSYFNVEEYLRAERHLKQFVNKYPLSELFIESQIWLGKTLIKLDKDDEALNYLLKVLAADSDDELRAQAYYYMGQVYFKKEAFDLARSQFRNVTELSDNDDLRARSQFLFAESYFKVEDYTAASSNYEEALKYDAHPDILFPAVMQWMHCFRELDDYEGAIALLEKVASQGRFLFQKGIIEAEIGETYKIQGKFIEATEIYEDVLRKYPRTEGSAIAAFGMAQLFEFAYANLDSARSLYLQVTKEFRKSELKEEADRRAAILESYKKLHQNIAKDLIERQQVLFQNNNVTADTLLQVEAVDSSGAVKKPPQKMRTLAEIESSLHRNRFAMAEFFLLNMANYDSAETSYKLFLSVSSDSILIPKTFYALYYIYSYGLKDQARADSMKLEIIQKYAETPYAAYFDSKKQEDDNEQEEVSPYYYKYLESEAFLYAGTYDQAIESFTRVAVEDSGSVYAQKARYAIAWIYEHKLEDISKAIDAYTIVQDEYPNSEMGKIAKNKIKVPVIETEVPVTNAETDTSGVEMVLPVALPDSLIPVQEEIQTEKLPEPVLEEEL